MLSVLTVAALIVTPVATPALPSVDSLAWLPANTEQIVGARGDQVPALKAMRDKPFPGTPDKKFPECWSRVTKPIVASYQVWGGVEDRESAMLAQGRIDRALAEACIEETMRLLERPVRMSRTGDITEFETERHGRGYVGWTASWVVWHSDRGRVEQLLGASRGKRSIFPVLAAAIARVDRSGTWFAITQDYSDRFIGVPAGRQTRRPRRDGSRQRRRAAVGDPCAGP
jgi:hypothetical protein